MPVVLVLQRGCDLVCRDLDPAIADFFCRADFAKRIHSDPVFHTVEAGFCTNPFETALESFRFGVALFDQRSLDLGVR